MRNICEIFIEVLQKYSYVFIKDYDDLCTIIPHKRKNFIESGVKIFIKKVYEDLKDLNMEVDFFFDNRSMEIFNDICISFVIMKQDIKEYIIYNPLKSQVFHTNRNNLYFNKKKIHIVESNNKMKISSNNIFFVSNLHICYLLLGAYSEVIIYKECIEKNKYALEICKEILYDIVNINNIDENLVISIKK